jgi:hypothetical protein
MTYTNLYDANQAVTRLAARVATLEDQVLKDDAELDRLRRELAGYRDAAAEVTAARGRIRQAVATFHERMDVHEATAVRLGLVEPTPTAGPTPTRSTSAPCLCGLFPGGGSACIADHP